MRNYNGDQSQRQECRSRILGKQRSSRCFRLSASTATKWRSFHSFALRVLLLPILYKIVDSRFCCFMRSPLPINLGYLSSRFTAAAWQMSSTQRTMYASRTVRKTQRLVPPTMGRYDSTSLYSSRQSTFAPTCAVVSRPVRSTCGTVGGVFRRSHLVMMPEGPEVRTLVDQVQGAVGRRLLGIDFLSGRYVRGEPPMGWSEFQTTMTPCDKESDEIEPIDLVKSWNCKGKFLYILLDDGKMPRKPNFLPGNVTTTNVTDIDIVKSRTSDYDFQRSIWITLGMTGKFYNEAAHAKDPQHARWVLELQDVTTGDTRKMYYHDARNFGTLKFCLSRQMLLDKLQSLGPDILQETTTVTDFCNIISEQKPTLNICKFLMNQSKLAGIGNYILAEALYRASIDPYCTLGEIQDDTECQERLFRAVKEVALSSYEAQGMTRAEGGQYRTVSGSRGTFEFDLQVYGQSTCPKGNPVRKDTNGPHGRTIWYTDEQLFMPRSKRFNSALTGNNDETDSSTSYLKMGSIENELGNFKRQACEHLLRGLTDEGWRNHLRGATIESESFQDLAQFLEDEVSVRGLTIYPPRKDIFTALNLCPFDSVRVVIVGQDPYHGAGQGHGLAFSVRKGVRPPPSLKNIIREVIDDLGIEEPKHGNLEHWARQGVLLLNTVLTVRAGEAFSHSKRGWEEFTDAIIRELNEKKTGIVFLLWGNHAAIKAMDVDETRHTVIKTSHPSPLGATKTNSPFLGSKCFSRANKALLDKGMDPIDWSIL